LLDMHWIGRKLAEVDQPVHGRHLHPAMQWKLAAGNHHILSATTWGMACQYAKRHLARHRQNQLQNLALSNAAGTCCILVSLPWLPSSQYTKQM
jgi:hypothetical protein